MNTSQVIKELLGSDFYAGCPCCGEIRRLSDLHITYGGKAPRTCLDTYERKVAALERREERFQEKEKQLREKARERGRMKVRDMIAGFLETGIAGLGYDPYDIKTVLHPI